MKKIVIFLLLVFFLTFTATDAQVDQTIVVQNYYWAKKGKLMRFMHIVCMRVK